MYLAIDIGIDFTHISAWDEGQSLSDASIKVRIPGLENYYSALGAGDKRPFREHLGFIFREYLLPSRLPIRTASFAVPGIPNLKARRMLLEIAEEIMGLDEVYIVPCPLSLVSGWSRSLNHSLSGDILLIESQDKTAVFSFLSVFADGRMILENTGRGKSEEIINAGCESGFGDDSSLNLDYLLIAGNPDQFSEINHLIASLAEKTRVVQVPEPGWTTINGLYQYRTQPGWFMIYPYNFYLDHHKPEHSSQPKLIFDTRNLELAMDGIYLLAKLDPGQYCANEPSGSVKLRILEVPNRYLAPKLDGDSQSVVMEINSDLMDLPVTLNIQLNLKTAALALELPTDNVLRSTTTPFPQRDWTLANLEHLYQKLTATDEAVSLLLAYEQFKAAYPPNPNLAEELQFCLFHLYGLLKVYNQ